MTRSACLAAFFLASVVCGTGTEQSQTVGVANQTEVTEASAGFSVAEEMVGDVAKTSLRGQYMTLAQYGRCEDRANGQYCGNFQQAAQSKQHSLVSCKAMCKTSKTCTGGYFSVKEGICYLYNIAGASAEICQDLRKAESSTVFSCTDQVNEKITCQQGPSSRSCANFARAAQSVQKSLADCEEVCKKTPKCSGGYFWGEKSICYLFGTPQAQDSHCGTLRMADATSTPFRCDPIKVKLRPSTVPNCMWSFSDCGTCRCVPIFVCPFCG